VDIMFSWSITECAPSSSGCGTICQYLHAAYSHRRGPSRWQQLIMLSYRESSVTIRMEHKSWIKYSHLLFSTFRHQTMKLFTVEHDRVKWFYSVVKILIIYKWIQHKVIKYLNFW